MDVETPEVEPVIDRKDLLSQQFDAVEEPAEIPTNTVNEQPVETVEAVEDPIWKRPPASWKKDYHEHWNKADPKLQEYAWQREEQMRRGVEPLMQKAQFADEMQGAIQPYMQTLSGLNIKPAQAVSALMQADHALRTFNPQEKLQYFMGLANSYGVNLSGQQLPPQQNIDPTVYALQNELNSVRGEVNTWKEQQEKMQNQVLQGEIDQFSQGAEHFEEARPIMIDLLNSGMAQSLEDAYDKAIRLDEGLFDQVNSAKQAKYQAQRSAELNRAAKSARAAAVSVRSSTPGINTASKAQDRRSLLAEQFDSMSDRL